MENKQLSKLNEKLYEVSQRYIVIENKYSYVLYDKSLSEDVTNLTTLEGMEVFVDGLILGRTTIG